MENVLFKCFILLYASVSCFVCFVIILNERDLKGMYNSIHEKYNNKKLLFFAWILLLFYFWLGCKSLESLLFDGIL